MEALSIAYYFQSCFVSDWLLVDKNDKLIGVGVWGYTLCVFFKPLDFDLLILYHCFICF